MADLRKGTASRLFRHDSASPMLPSNCDCDNSLLPPIPGVLIDIPIASNTVLGGVITDDITVKTDKKGVLSVKVIEENGLKIKTEGIFLSLASETQAGALSAEDYNKIKNLKSQENIIEGVLLGSDNQEASITENKKVIIPIAGAFLGLVKNTNLDNGISIKEDGTMEVNKISISKIFVPEDEEFILNCGNNNIIMEG